MTSRRALVSWWAGATFSVALKMVPVIDYKVRRAVLHMTLRQLNDALAMTPLHEHYWMEGGLLLGWARWGDALPNDAQDADFFFLDEDYPKFVAAVPGLEKAGFKVKEVLRDNEGDVIAVHFTKYGVQFDFLKVTAKDGELVVKALYEQPVQFTLTRPDSPRVWFEVFGRRWLKPDDHESILASQYGDWRERAVVTRRGWPAWRGSWRSERDNPGVVAREPWNWTGPVGCYDGDLSEHRQTWGSQSIEGGNGEH